MDDLQNSPPKFSTKDPSQMTVVEIAVVLKIVYNVDYNFAKPKHAAEFLRKLRAGELFANIPFSNEETFTQTTNYQSQQPSTECATFEPATDHSGQNLTHSSQNYEVRVNNTQSQIYSHDDRTGISQASFIPPVVTLDDQPANNMPYNLHYSQYHKQPLAVAKKSGSGIFGNNIQNIPRPLKEGPHVPNMYTKQEYHSRNIGDFVGRVSTVNGNSCAPTHSSQARIEVSLISTHNSYLHPINTSLQQHGDSCYSQPNGVIGYSNEPQHVYVPIIVIPPQLPAPPFDKSNPVGWLKIFEDFATVGNWDTHRRISYLATSLSIADERLHLNYGDELFAQSWEDVKRLFESQYGGERSIIETLTEFTQDKQQQETVSTPTTAIGDKQLKPQLLAIEKIGLTLNNVKHVNQDFLEQDYDLDSHKFRKGSSYDRRNRDRSSANNYSKHSSRDRYFQNHSENWYKYSGNEHVYGHQKKRSRDNSRRGSCNKKKKKKKN